MKTIKSKKGDVTWNVINEEIRQTGKGTKTFYSVECAQCGYIKTGQKANLRILVACPGCTKKPAALKTDGAGNCVTICRIGQVEYIHKLITDEGLTQREAAQTFIEAMQAHSAEGDPLTADLTVEQIRLQYRRDAGKFKDKIKDTKTPRVAATQEITVPSLIQSSNNSKVEKKRPCLPSVVGVQAFLDEHLPGFRIVPYPNGEM